jgi:thermostable 8-oxoguanine DNA glycosylase
MLKKVLSLVVVVVVFHAGFCVQTASARSKAEKQARFAERVKAGIVQLGVGEESYVTVKLRDKTKLAGYISEAREESFVVTDLKTSEATTVAYTDVKKVKGHNLSTGAQIAIGVGVAFAVVLIVVALTVGFGD